jgi:hypothetical protein
MGCSAQSFHRAVNTRVVITGTVEEICKGCDVFDLVNGGALVWDVLKVRIASPAHLSGKVVPVEVLLEGDASAQQSVYSIGNRITFSTSEGVVGSERVKFHASDIHGG